ncbi:ATP-dependent RNA helicase [Lentinula raphanica]|nr:ATP-dependent RNA helicase [Lentinula raphanica]
MHSERPIDFFSFLDNPFAQTEEWENLDESASEDSVQITPSSKRKIPSTPEIGSVPPKKAKRDTTPKSIDTPMVLDAFETEAKREVAASADLTGGTAIAGPRLELKHQVRHQVAVPRGYDYVPISQHIPHKPAREYKFTLDPFQQVSIYAIQRNESVLVSAHTSAGKTVIAEYAIAQCLERKQRVVYTSPIKALSNQKYRDMVAEFGDVGLMTGDVTINPSATCLVMTTEILRSMLYRGSEIIREVAWVIFDEIHYMRDKERGVVWEESIILLSHNVRYVFLSATIPNAMQFAEWICHVHDQPCHVVYTDFRPTPLQHYLFPRDDEGIYLIVNEKGEFRDDNFAKAMKTVQTSSGDNLPADNDGGKIKKRKPRQGTENLDLVRIIKLITTKNHHPVIVFSFVRQECDAYALSLSKFKFNSSDEEDLVSTIFANAVESLSPDDRNLPYITQLVPLLKRGIGIHHSGLLPVLKEVVEILFQEGLLKVLFATETFSIGLNMPAKTVVFTGTRKFDGREQRNLTSGEYIQMSGRAGRRGLDDRGMVIIMCDEKLDPIVAKEMIKGEADRLDSAFHINYNMILNLMRVEGVSPEYLLGRCFRQFQNMGELPKMSEELRKQKQHAESISILHETQVGEYYDCQQQLQEMTAHMREVVRHPSYILPQLKVGRLIKVKHGNLEYGWGVVICFHAKEQTKKLDDTPPNEKYIVDVLLHIAPESKALRKGWNNLKTPGNIKPFQAGQKGVSVVVPVALSTIDQISRLLLYVPHDLRPEIARQTLWKSLLETQRRFPEGIPLLDPIKDMGIVDDNFKRLVQKTEALEDKLCKNPLHGDSKLAQLMARFHEKKQCQDRARAIRKQMQDIQQILELDELKCRKRILRRLEFVSADDVVEVKGRVACEISSGDALMLTELIFAGAFTLLQPEHCAALLSCFVFDEKSEQPTKLPAELVEPLRLVQQTARRIATVARESKIDINEEQYATSFKIELMNPVIHWCNGASFTEISKMADKIFEGSLIRVFRRLSELLRQMDMAAKVIGNVELQQKFERASGMLERPNSVIFCPSLYL